MSMPLLITLLMLASVSVFAQEDSADAARLRSQYSQSAGEARVREAAAIANRGLATAGPEVNCEEEPRTFVVVGVSGYGTGRNGEGQPSGAHDNLPYADVISSNVRLTHSASREEMEDVLNSICGTAAPAGRKPGLIIMANSWGAAAGRKLAEKYEERCGELVELFVMVDGVKKPIGASKKTPRARRCVNYFETRSTVHGAAIEGCENNDLGARCSGGGLGTCHVEVEWMGTEMGAREILETVGGT